MPCHTHVQQGATHRRGGEAVPKASPRARTHACAHKFHMRTRTTQSLACTLARTLALTPHRTAPHARARTRARTHSQAPHARASASCNRCGTVLDGRKVTEEELRAHLAQCTDKKAHAAYAKRKRAVAEKAPHSRCNARARACMRHMDRVQLVASMRNCVGDCTRRRAWRQSVPSRRLRRPPRHGNSLCATSPLQHT
jgi:hypothetical protein